MINRRYVYWKPRSRKGDAVCAELSLYWHGKEMVALEIHGDIVRFYNLKPKRKEAVVDVLDALKEVAKKRGCRMLAYYGEMDADGGEILKEYGFTEDKSVMGEQRWFELCLSDE